jgi:predicted dehydrogenase
LIHAADLALWAAGGEPQKICGITSNTAGTGFIAPDNAEVLFETSTGVVCNITMGVARITGQKSGLCIYGSEGSVELEYTHTGYSLKTFTRQNREGEEEHQDNLYRNQMFEREDREFLEDILSGNQRGCTVADAERSLKIYWEVYGKQQ